MTEKTVWRIAVIPGDGIGTEVVREGQRVLDALAEDSGGRIAFEWESFPWGSEYYLVNGRMMAEDALETLEGFDAIYFGAVGHPEGPPLLVGERVHDLSSGCACALVDVVDIVHFDRHVRVDMRLDVQLHHAQLNFWPAGPEKHDPVEAVAALEPDHIMVERPAFGEPL